MRLYQRVLAFGPLLVLNIGFFLLLSSILNVGDKVDDFETATGNAEDMESLMSSLEPIEEALDGVRRSARMGIGFLTVSIAMAAVAFFGPGHEAPRKLESIE